MASTEEDTAANLTEPSTAFSTTLDTSNSKLDITREEFEKRQLLHRVELLKLELSQKTMVIDTLRNEQTAQVEELRYQLSDALHQQKMVHMRLKSETHIHEQEVKRLKSLVHDLEKQREEEEERRRLESDSGDEGKEGGGWGEVKEAIRGALHQSLLSKEEYLSLRGRHGGESKAEWRSDKQTLSDYVRVRMYEITEPLLQSQRRLEGTVAELTAQLTARDQEMVALRESASTLTSQLQVSEQRSQQLITQLNQVKAHTQGSNYKIATYDHLARERDALKSEVEQLRGRMSQLDSVLNSAVQDRDAAQREMASLQQRNSLLQQDKEYLSRQVGELSGRVVAAEGREETLSHKLAESQTARDSLYRETIQIRERERAESEERLQRELQKLRDQAKQELEHTISYTRDLYERENRAVTESYHRAGDERDRAVAGEREACRKYEQLLQDHHKLQSRMEARMSELEATIQVKTFEYQQIQTDKETVSKQLREIRLLADTLQKKVDVLSEEVCRVKGESGEKVRVLEGRVQEQTERLKVYQQVETDMDDVILQAAQAENESDAERILFTYGFGTNLPTTAKRRAQQSVRLARRVLQLERVNSALRKDSEYEREQSQKLQEELAEVRSLLSEVGQPQSCMVQSLKRSREEARSHRDRASALQRELEHVKLENKQLHEMRTQLAADLQTLLSHRQELSGMKQLLLGLQGRHTCVPPPPPGQGQGDTEVDNQLTPCPVLFTKQQGELGSWYRNDIGTKPQH